MKKIFIFLLILLSILIIIYITKNKDIILNKEYLEDNITIEYPYFNNKDLDNYINNYLTNAIETFKYNDNNELFIDYDYNIINNVLNLILYQYEIDDNKLTYNTKNLNINLDSKKITTTNKKDTTSKEYDLYTNKIIDKTKPMVALTFDDGPNHNTSKIIDILNKYNVKATFFILGVNIEGNEEIIQKLNDSDMLLGNHGYSHKLLTKLTEEQIKEEFSKTSNLIYNITGKYPTLTRPSYGATNKKIKNSINTPIISWNIDTLDWKYHNSTKIASKVLNKVTDGNIILMHDIYTATSNSLEIIIPKLLEKGYQLVTIEELFYYKQIELENSKVYYNAK
jgi:peptidoglycan/xylan/chitin deacetylase (PgdA/CDA1 family)